MTVINKELEHLIPIIEKSKRMLELDDDWDDEGSIGYTQETWDKSIQFLIDYNMWYLKIYNRLLEVPKIYIGPKGGIDIIWENTNTLFIYLNKEVTRIDYYFTKGDDIGIEDFILPSEYNKLPNLYED